MPPPTPGWAGPGPRAAPPAATGPRPPPGQAGPAPLRAPDAPAAPGAAGRLAAPWHRKFQEHGPAGLEGRPRGGPTGSRLAEVTRRAILMMKESHPDGGVEKIRALLLRGPPCRPAPRPSRASCR